MRSAQSSAAASALLLGVDDETPSATDLLSSAERALSQLVRLDDSQNSLLERIGMLECTVRRLRLEATKLANRALTKGSSEAKMTLSRHECRTFTATTSLWSLGTAAS